MKRNLKKAIALAIVGLLLLVATGFTYAEEQHGMAASERSMVRWVGLNSVTGTFEILSNGMANPIVRGTTHEGMADYVNVAVSLKKNTGSSWSTIKSWNKNITVALNKFTFNETYKVSKNYSYKYTATVKCYHDGALVDSVTFDSKVVAY